jgi:hypothetical protein
MKVGQAARHDLDLDVVLGSRAERHQRHARLERQQIRSIMRGTLGKDANPDDTSSEEELRE